MLHGLLVLSLVAAADPELYKKLDDCYARRDAAEKECDAQASDAVKANAEDYGVLWRASRWKFWLSDGATDSRLKKQLGKEGWELGDRATKANPSGPEASTSRRSAWATTRPRWAY